MRALGGGGVLLVIQSSEYLLYVDAEELSYEIEKGSKRPSSYYRADNTKIKMICPCNPIDRVGHTIFDLATDRVFGVLPQAEMISGGSGAHGKKYGFDAGGIQRTNNVFLSQGFLGM